MLFNHISRPQERFLTQPKSPKNCPLGPKQVKNDYKIKKISNFKRKETKKMKVVQVHEQTPKQLSNPTPTPKIAH